MASLIGHVLGAEVVWALGQRLGAGWLPSGPWGYVLVGTMAAVPDFDVVIPVLFTGGPVGHRGASHSVLAALGLALAATVLLCTTQHSQHCLGVFGVLTLCALMHPVLDYLMACGPKVPFLWPLSRQGWLCPVQLIPTAYYATTGSGLLAVAFDKRTWIGIALESLSLGSIWLAVHSARPGVTGAFLAASGSGFILTFLIYR